LYDLLVLTKQTTIDNAQFLSNQTTHLHTLKKSVINHKRCSSNYLISVKI